MLCNTCQRCEASRTVGGDVTRQTTMAACVLGAVRSDVSSGTTAVACVLRALIQEVIRDCAALSTRVLSMRPAAHCHWPCGVDTMTGFGPGQTSKGLPICASRPGSQ